MKYKPNFMLWMYYKIKYKIPLSLSNRVYQNISYSIVKKEDIEKYKTVDICDTSLVDNNGAFKYPPFQKYNGIMYNFLKQGYNCGMGDVTGFVYVFPICSDKLR
jgi:hypothetical protein